jgi:hypothetical protein
MFLVKQIVLELELDNNENKYRTVYEDNSQISIY